MRLFVEDLKGYINVFNNVYRVAIRKKDNKNVLVVEYSNKTGKDILALKEISLAYLIDIETMHEYFRYDKKEV